jgi:hypothetical protein
MTVDFFENGLCFYCHLAKNELLTYKDFHCETEKFWQKKDEALQNDLQSILGKYPDADHDEIVESHGWDLHLNQIKYPDIHRTALVVAIYIFIEDQLNGLCQTLQESIGTRLRLKDINGKGVERSFLFLSKVVGFDLSRISSKPFVTNVNKLRNKIVHAGGLLPDNDSLNEFVKRTNGLWGNPGGRVNIASEFIENLIDQLIILFDEIDVQVQEFISKTIAQQSLPADARTSRG